MKKTALLIIFIHLLSACNSSKENENTITDNLASGGKAPRMTPIPAGSFTMGCLQKKDCNRSTLPAHEVTIPAFFASQSEITIAQWQQCYQSGACLHKAANEFDDDSLPVTNVSWKDTQKYTEWLSNQTGKKYRLLSEAEWEYVARAGTKSLFWWGDTMEQNQANCLKCGSRWDEKQPAPIKSFAANPFGLFDTHGNVWEWTQDCWHNDYQQAPNDGSSWQSENCKYRVIRSGSYFGEATSMYSSNRNSTTDDKRLSNIGFRVARGID